MVGFANNAGYDLKPGRQTRPRLRSTTSRAPLSKRSLNVVLLVVLMTTLGRAPGCGKSARAASSVAYNLFA